MSDDELRWILDRLLTLAEQNELLNRAHAPSYPAQTKGGLAAAWNKESPAAPARIVALLGEMK